MSGGVFGLGIPTTSLASLQYPWSVSPYGAQAFGTNPFAASQLYGQPLQQILQVLQVIPQQLQQLQQLQHLQAQQLQQLQQLIQFIPQQLQQLQPVQFQQMQPPWALSPQIFGAQPVHVM